MRFGIRAGQITGSNAIQLQITLESKAKLQIS